MRNYFCCFLQLTGSRAVTASLNSVIFLEQDNLILVIKGFRPISAQGGDLMELKFNENAARGAENYRQQIAANNKRQKNGVEGGYKRARKHKYLYDLML